MPGKTKKKAGSAYVLDAHAVHGKVPDLYDWLGAAVCMAGIAIIMWGPRG